MKYKIYLKNIAINFVSFVLFAALLLNSSVQADLIASFESSETSLTFAPSDLVPAIVTGGIAGAPNATEGTKVLRCAWMNQPDNKVHVSLGGLNFDLAGFNWLFIDIYMPTDLFAGSAFPDVS